MSAPLSVDPFTHLLIPYFVSSYHLDQVVADLPDFRGGGSYPPDAVRLGSSARSLIDELQGERLRSVIGARFSLDLSTSPTMLTIRGRTRQRDGSIHRDSDTKLVTVLLYLNPSRSDWTTKAGCLRLLRSPDSLEDFAVEVRPVDGTLLVFPNGPTTYHGHEPFVGRRYVIQLNYMATNSKARHEMRRHRISAFLKRFLPL